MRFDPAARALEGIPYTSPAKGWVFYELVMKRRPRRILELGFAHGVSTCYFAAAAEELGDCQVTAVDIEVSRTFSPTIEEVVARLGLGRWITVQRETSSYTWFLKKEIARQTRDHVCEPLYDLIFIDGPKDWTNDGCAFFLADKLLRPGGVILFDDYAWSYRDDEQERGVRHDRGYIFEHMSEEEFREPHIRAVFELLVMQHPAYGRFEVIDDQLALAEKTAATGAPRLTFESRYSLRYRLLATARRWWAARSRIS